MAIKTQFRATFDGRVLVPEQDLGLCPGDSVELTMETASQSPDGRTIEERLKAFESAFGTVKTDIVLPLSAFDRDENMYPDRL